MTYKTCLLSMVIAFAIITPLKNSLKACLIFYDKFTLLLQYWPNISLSVLLSLYFVVNPTAIASLINTAYVICQMTFVTFPVMKCFFTPGTIYTKTIRLRTTRRFPVLNNLRFHYCITKYKKLLIRQHFKHFALQLVRCEMLDAYGAKKIFKIQTPY